MWTTNGWFGFNRLNLDEARNTENTKQSEENVTEEAIDEARVQTVSPNFKGVRRTDNLTVGDRVKSVSRDYPVNAVGVVKDVHPHGVKVHWDGAELPAFVPHTGVRKINEAIYHNVDWDGPSKVKVVRHNANEIEVRRVDKNNKEMKGDDHSTTYTKHDPEFREIKSKIQAADDHDAWKEKRAAALQGRRYHESVEFNEEWKKDGYERGAYWAKHPVSGGRGFSTKSQRDAFLKQVNKTTKTNPDTIKKKEVDLEESMLTSLIEGTVYHGPYELTSGKAMKGMGEGEPTHVHAHQRKMNKLGVPQHDKDDYGNTVLVHVKDTRTGDKTVHHVYQRGFTEPGNKEGKKVVSVRTVGQARPKSAKHNDVIKNYLSGKHFKNLQEQWIEDAILTTMVEEALAAKRSLNETRIEKDLQDHEPRIVHGYKGMKQRPFSKKFKNQEHMEKWMDSDSSADHDIHTIEKA